MTSSYNPWLHGFAVFAAICTWALIGLGGLVTSHGVGMSVPDWPTTYGYNMFLFPISQWVGGVFYEHTHRLVASGVGVLTSVLAIWLWSVETKGSIRRNGILSLIAILLLVGAMMGVRNHRVFLTIAAVSFAGIIFGFIRATQTRGLRWLGVAALSAVVLQGILGGLRVTEMKDEIGIFHATLAQLFLVLLSAIALFTSRWWHDGTEVGRVAARSTVRLPHVLSRFVLAITFLIFLQLILGATMRHQHAGLAVPDFPLAYGKIWPPTDAASIALINQRRLDARDPNPIRANQIRLHMMHRFTAFLILGGVIFIAWKFRQTFGAQNKLAHLALIWLAMIGGQVMLGIVTVLKNKPADIATAHVVLGAASLVMGAMIWLITEKISVEPENPIRHGDGASSVKPASNFKAAPTTP